MAYLIDRQRAFRMAEVVIVLSVRRGRARSQVVFQDNSLYWTLTRPRTFLRRDAEASAGVKATVS